jgi:predicted MFS family arabinose efflux permease
VVTGFQTSGVRDGGVPLRTVVVVTVGLVSGGLGWPGLIGRLPIGLYLKNQLGLSAEQVSRFWLVATLAWFAKPLVGLVCDGFPLGGTRRRGYLLLGSAIAAAGWLSFAVVPRTYGALLAVMVVLNLGLVVVSTSLGGLLVEEGQRSGGTGRLSALRTIIDGAVGLAAGVIAGRLAMSAFGWTAAFGAVAVAAMIPVTLATLREPKAPADTHFWAATEQRLKAVVRNRGMWAVAVLGFMVFVTPGLQTPLLYYREDVLKLDPAFQGRLQSLTYAGWIAGALVYAFACRRLPLRLTLVVTLAISAGAALLYLGYRPGNAAVVDAITGFTGALVFAALLDLAARATPAGSETLGYALLLAVQNLAQFLSDVVGSRVYDHLRFGFGTLVWANAISTAVLLIFVPLLPKALLAASDRRRKYVE